MTTEHSRTRCIAALVALAGVVALCAGTMPGAVGAAGASTVQVQPGQTLTAIAAEYHTTVAALVAANGIADPNHIVAGTALTLPGSTPPPVAAVATPARTVTVMTGDTLSDIAARYGVTVASLAASNGIANPNQILVGETLTVPGGTTAGASAATTPPPQPPTVMVMIGDTLTAIAARYGVTVASLAAANGITNPNLVTVGRQLVIPTANAAPASPSGATSPLPSQLLAEPAILALRPVFVRWAAAFGLNPALLEAMCWWESGWQSQIVSPTGAIGIGQLEPPTVAAMQAQLGQPNLNPYVPSDNIEMAAAFLGDLLKATGNTQAALAGYYQGLTSVALFGEFPGTMQYATGITAYIPAFS